MDMLVTVNRVFDCTEKNFFNSTKQKDPVRATVRFCWFEVESHNFSYFFTFFVRTGNSYGPVPNICHSSLFYYYVMLSCNRENEKRS